MCILGYTILTGSTKLEAYSNSELMGRIPISQVSVNNYQYQYCRNVVNKPILITSLIIGELLTIICGIAGEVMYGTAQAQRRTRARVSICSC